MAKAFDFICQGNFGMQEQADEEEEEKIKIEDNMMR